MNNTYIINNTLYNLNCFNPASALLYVHIGFDMYPYIHELRLDNTLHVALSHVYTHSASILRPYTTGCS